MVDSFEILANKSLMSLEDSVKKFIKFTIKYIKNIMKIKSNQIFLANFVKYITAYVCAGLPTLV